MTGKLTGAQDEVDFGCKKVAEGAPYRYVLRTHPFHFVLVTRQAQATRPAESLKIGKISEGFSLMWQEVPFPA